MTDSAQLNEDELAMLVMTSKLTGNSVQELLKNVGIFGTHSIFYEYVEKAKQANDFLPIQLAISNACIDYHRNKKNELVKQIKEKDSNIFLLESEIQAKNDRITGIKISNSIMKSRIPTTLLGFVLGVLGTFVFLW